MEIKCATKNLTKAQLNLIMIHNTSSYQERKKEKEGQKERKR